MPSQAETETQPPSQPLPLAPLEQTRHFSANPDAILTPPPPAAATEPKPGETSPTPLALGGPWQPHGPQSPLAQSVQQQAYAQQQQIFAQQKQFLAQQQQDYARQQELYAQQQKVYQQQWREYQDNQRAEQRRLEDTAQAMFRQTNWASAMFAATFLLGMALIFVSVGIVIWRPQTSNPLVAVFFGVGALSMLAFFLRDPADKIQRAGGNLVQLQMAFRLSNYEWSYWGTFFNDRRVRGQEITAKDINDALTSTRQTTLEMMRQINASLGDAAKAPAKKAAAKS